MVAMGFVSFEHFFVFRFFNHSSFLSLSSSGIEIRHYGETFATLAFAVKLILQTVLIRCRGSTSKLVHFIHLLDSPVLRRSHPASMKPPLLLLPVVSRRRTIEGDLATLAFVQKLISQTRFLIVCRLEARVGAYLDRLLSHSNFHVANALTKSGFETRNNRA